MTKANALKAVVMMTEENPVGRLYLEVSLRSGVTVDALIVESSKAAVRAVQYNTDRMGGFYTPPTTAEDAINTWSVPAGIAAPGSYRIVATVTDSIGVRFAASTTVLVGDVLTLAVDASRNHVGTGTGFSLVTRRIGGETNFTYTFAVLDAANALLRVGQGRADVDDGTRHRPVDRNVVTRHGGSSPLQAVQIVSHQDRARVIRPEARLDDCQRSLEGTPGTVEVALVL